MADEKLQSALSPDEALAVTITDAIAAANLVIAEKLPRVRDGLRKGNLTSDDWKLLIELGNPDKTAGGT